MTGVAQLHTVDADFGAVDRVARVTSDNRIAQFSLHVTYTVAQEELSKV